MRTRSLMAIKPHKYGTRQLTAGEEYEAPIKHAFALVAGRKARFAPDKPAVEASRAKAPEPEPEPDEAMVAEEVSEYSLDGLRLQATQLGVNVDGRWGMARLRYEIEQARRA
jgi:hypothetical protein